MLVQAIQVLVWVVERVIIFNILHMPRADKSMKGLAYTSIVLQNMITGKDNFIGMGCQVCYLPLSWTFFAKHCMFSSNFNCLPGKKFPFSFLFFPDQ